MKRILPALIILMAFCNISAQEPFDLQAAINAACNGCTVVVPAGVYEVGDIVINQNSEWQKVVTLQGIAPAHLGHHPPQGHTQWDYLINGGYVYGTVLRGHITMTNGGRLYLRDLSMIGHGEGIAVDYGDGVYMFPHGGLYNVAFGNYDTAVRLRKAYYMTLSDLDIAGVATGIQIANSNAIQLSSIDIMACGLGADLGGNGNTWTGGSVQGCSDGVRLGGMSNVLGGVYFEQIAGKSIELTGQGWSVLSNFYATNSGQIYISGKSNDIVLGVNPIAPIELTATSSYNYVRGSAYLTCNDYGFRNRCERLWP